MNPPQAQVIRVSLQPALRRAPAPCAQSALDSAGPLACIGGDLGVDQLAAPVKPDARSLFGPRGACLLGADGPLWICDTGHHRLLGWARAPRGDSTPADWLIGQPDFEHEGRNAKGEPNVATLNVPTGVSACGDGLVVADAWNHRVLIWRQAPRASHTLADLVLGQAAFGVGEANRGGDQAGADTLFWPYGVHWDGARLWVADAGNRRVLMWRGLPTRNGQPADLVLGQPNFTGRDENGGGTPGSATMRWPHAVASWNGRLCVTDAGNNRIMIWNTVPDAQNAPCDAVLGQADFRGVDHNQSLYWPGAGTLHMPYGIAAAGDWCLAADTANSRVIAWHRDAAVTGAAAQALTGQSEFNNKGDNGWLPQTRVSLSWPYGISVCADIAVVADSGNNRVLLWPLAAALRA